MSYADGVFKKMCNNILNKAISTEGENVRPVWIHDGISVPAYTLKDFGVVNRYNLQDEFPILTIRPIALKSAINEIRWIYQKKSNNIHDLKLHIWDSWANDDGSIGKAYGYQVGKISHYKDGDYDQMDRLLKDLKEEPFGRRHIINLYNVDELHEMNLYPCCWSCTFNVTRNSDGRLVLNLLLNQRSNDILAANAWNVVQYAALLMMVARHVDMISGELLHVIADAHIYDKHVPIITDLIKLEEYDAPIVRIKNTAPKNFYDITEDDFEIINYVHGPRIERFDVAV